MTEVDAQMAHEGSMESDKGDLRAHRRGDVALGTFLGVGSRRSHENAAPVKNEALYTPCDSKCLLAVMRIVFGAVFLVDGFLKWYLLATNQMQGVVGGMGGMIYYTPAWLTSNWLFFGVMIGLAETFGGLCLILGIFQRPAALWSSAIMFSIWIFGGFGGLPNALGIPWSQAAYTDLGGDLMLALVYLFLAFAPSTYGLASYLRLSERFASGSRMWDRFVRTILA